MAQVFWTTGTGPAQKGDLVYRAPLLTGPFQQQVDDADKLVSLLWTVSLNWGLIVAEPPGLLWIAPVRQRGDYRDPGIFDALMAAAVRGGTGYFPLDPMPGAFDTAALAMLDMPSALPRASVDIAGAQRAATLSPLYLAALTGAMHGRL